MPEQIFHGLISDLPMQEHFDGLAAQSGIRMDDALVAFGYLYPSAPDVPMHDHPFDQLALCIQGEMEVTVDGVAHVVEAGGFIYIPEGLTHGIRRLQGDPLLSAEIFAPAREDWLHLAAHQPH